MGVGDAEAQEDRKTARSLEDRFIMSFRGMLGWRCRDGIGKVVMRFGDVTSG